ncbi:MAG: antitoxin [Limnospira sp.]
MSAAYRVQVTREGDRQTLTIPREFALSSSEVIIRQEGRKLIVEPYPCPTLLDVFATLDDLDEDFPDSDRGVLPLDDIEL